MSTFAELRRCWFLRGGWEFGKEGGGDHLTAHCKLTKNVEGGVGKMPLAAAAAAMQH